jgi:hypothetical protein
MEISRTLHACSIGQSTATGNLAGNSLSLVLFCRILPWVQKPQRTFSKKKLVEGKGLAANILHSSAMDAGEGSVTGFQHSLPRRTFPSQGVLVSGN